MRSSPVVMTGCSIRCIVARSPPLNEVHVALEHFDFRWPLPHVVGSPHRRVLSASLTACEPSDRPRFIGLATLTASAGTHGSPLFATSPSSTCRGYEPR